MAKKGYLLQAIGRHQSDSLWFTKTSPYKRRLLRYPVYVPTSERTVLLFANDRFAEHAVRKQIFRWLTEGQKKRWLGVSITLLTEPWADFKGKTVSVVPLPALSMVEQASVLEMLYDDEAKLAHGLRSPS